MKRKIALLLACLLIAGIGAGCNSSNKTSDASDSSSASASADESTKSSTEGKDTSSASKAGDTSSAGESGEGSKEGESSKKSESSQKTSDGGKTSGEGSVTETSGVTIDDDGNIVIDIGDISDWEEDSEGDDDTEDSNEESVDENGRKPLFNDMTYQMIYLAPDGFESGTKLPESVVITSAKELQDFIAANKTTYSLETEHTDDDYINKTSFVNETRYMNDEFFNDTELLVIASSYKKGTECDIGDIYSQDGVIHIELSVDSPGFTDSTGYVCFVMPVEKGTFSGKKLSLSINPMVIEGEDEDE